MFGWICRLNLKEDDRTSHFIDRKDIVFKDSARTNWLRLFPKWSVCCPRMRSVEIKTKMVGSKKTPSTSAKFELTVFESDRIFEYFSFIGGAIGLQDLSWAVDSD